MKTTLAALTIFLIWTGLITAQTSPTGIDVGTRLVVQTDQFPDLYLQSLLEPNMIWDASSLDFDQLQSFTVKQPYIGRAIPVIGEADYLITSGKNEYYYSRIDNSLILIGSTVTDFFNPEDTDHIIRYSGLEEFNDDYLLSEVTRSEAAGSVELYADDLSQKITDVWDELNFRYLLKRNISQTVTRMAAGQLILPGEQHDVTQVLVERVIEQHIVAKDIEGRRPDVAVISDIDDLIIEKEIRFYKMGYALPILKVRLDSATDDLIDIQVITSNYDSSPEITSTRENIVIQPNPTFGKSEVNIQVNNPGTYSIIVKNILGRVLYQEQVQLDRNATVPINVMSLRKGSYFCSLVDYTGRTIRTKRLIILKP